MKHKLISAKSGKLLSYLNKAGKDCFTVADAHKALPESSGSALLELLSDMTKRGLLMRLKQGIYYRIPYEEDSESFMPNWHLLAKYLVNEADHYIGYYSAMEIHNLITQPSLKEQIVVSQQVRPSTYQIKNVTFQFIYHNKKHFFGSEKIWIDSYNKVQCSDLEKTIVDCLYKPDYAGGIVEIARGIFVSKDIINFERLFKYVQKFQTQVVVKRLGFLLELLDIDTNIIPGLLDIKTESYTVLDTELPQTGKMISRWSIRQNVDSHTIKSAIYT